MHSLRMVLAWHLVIGQQWMIAWVVYHEIHRDWPRPHTLRDVPEVGGGIMLGMCSRLVAWPYYLWQWLR